MLKQSLILAHNRQDLYGWVPQSTSGIVFLGTPHHGAEAAYWSRLFGRLVKLPSIKVVRNDLLQDLEPKSRILGDICTYFVERAKGLPIYSFYERHKLKGLNELVVDEHSAILHLPTERPIPLELDHHMICKYLSSSSQAYALVLDGIMDLVESSAPEQLDATAST